MDSPLADANDNRGRLYPDGARQLQDHFDSRRLADRLTEVTVADRIDSRLKDFIEAQPFFWLATVDTDGFPDVSYKGGAPGFVRCPTDTTIRFPSYDGNGMYRSLGNVVDNGRVALLFVRFGDRPARYRVHGTAVVLTDDESRADFIDAEAVVEVTVGRAFYNCGRYVHDLESGTLSSAAPRAGHVIEPPEWKQWDQFRDVLPGT